jgi:DNA-binding Xre family transcriptional regulator
MALQMISLEGEMAGKVIVKVPGLLEERGMTVREFSKRTGLAYGTASALARGFVDRVDLRTLAAVCDALEVGVGDILEFIPDEKPVNQTAPSLRTGPPLP